MSSEIQLMVAKTALRGNVRGEFIAQIDPSMIRTLKGAKPGRYVIVNNKNNRDFLVPAVLQPQSRDDKKTIGLDQKLRTAIGVVPGENVTVSLPQKQHLSFWRVLLEFFFGIQANLARVGRASYGDMEIYLCRVRSDVMKTIAVDEGDIIIVESVSHSVKIRVLELPKSEEDERIISDTKDNSHISDFLKNEMTRLNATKIMDLPWIFLDEGAREILKVQHWDTVRIYRSIGHCIRKRIHLFSLPLLITVIGSILTITDMTSELKLVLIGITLFLVLFFNFWEIRNKIK